MQQKNTRIGYYFCHSVGGDCVLRDVWQPFFVFDLLGVMHHISDDTLPVLHRAHHRQSLVEVPQ
ncbi:MAG: hypothetical protein IJ191_05780 [Treponema sp.]|nr:hypothetical protein [Treponema sp.]